MNKEPSLDYIIEDLVKSLRGTEEDWQIKSIKAFILKALKSQRKKFVDILKAKKLLYIVNLGVDKKTRDLVINTHNSELDDIINLITKEDE